MPRLSGAARSSGSEANFAVVLAGSDAIWCKVWHCHESCISGSTKAVRHIFRNCPRVKTLGVEKTFRTPQTVHAYSHRVTLLPLDKRVAVAKRSSPSGRWRTRTKRQNHEVFAPSKWIHPIKTKENPRKTPGNPQGSPSTGGQPKDFSAPRSQSENVFQLRSDPDPTSSYEIMELIPLEMGSSANPCAHPQYGSYISKFLGKHVQFLWGEFMVYSWYIPNSGDFPHGHASTSSDFWAVIDCTTTWQGENHGKLRDLDGQTMEYVENHGFLDASGELFIWINPERI